MSDGGAKVPSELTEVRVATAKMVELTEAALDEVAFVLEHRAFDWNQSKARCRRRRYL